MAWIEVWPAFSFIAQFLPRAVGSQLSAQVNLCFFFVLFFMRIVTFFQVWDWKRVTGCNIYAFGKELFSIAILWGIPETYIFFSLSL